MRQPLVLLQSYLRHEAKTFSNRSRTKTIMLTSSACSSSIPISFSSQASSSVLCNPRWVSTFHRETLLPVLLISHNSLIWVSSITFQIWTKLDLLVKVCSFDFFPLCVSKWVGAKTEKLWLWVVWLSQSERFLGCQNARMFTRGCMGIWFVGWSCWALSLRNWRTVMSPSVMNSLELLNLSGLIWIRLWPF